MKRRHRRSFASSEMKQLGTEMFGVVVKIPAYHTEVPRANPQLLLLSSVFCQYRFQETMVNAQVVEFLIPTQETCTKLLDPGFSSLGE